MMVNKQPLCAHTCKEYCNALEIASRYEKEAILKYASIRDECSYPDIKVMLNELIIEHKKSIDLLEKTKNLLQSKFEVLDQIRGGFEMS